ncbi:MAG: Alpha-amylase/4-alpha-glucanotransferase, C-terminal, partial [Chloroflexota bacterium]|nr:Alpha-amylase/4-alpha-glucanotransferase, C-terminal [Chloroflexota bacterium]
DDAASVSDVSRLRAGNDQLGITVETTTDRPVATWIAPIQTVSNSEGGFELVYQGSATLLVAPLQLAAGESFRMKIEQEVTVLAERFAGSGPEPRSASTTREVEPGPR